MCCAPTTETVPDNTKDGRQDDPHGDPHGLHEDIPENRSTTVGIERMPVVPAVYESSTGGRGDEAPEGDGGESGPGESSERGEEVRPGEDGDRGDSGNEGPNGPESQTNRNNKNPGAVSQKPFDDKNNSKHMMLTLVLLNCFNCIFRHLTKNVYIFL